MIGFLNGEVAVSDGQNVIIDVAGVGYRVFVPSSVLPKIGKDKKLKLFIYTHVREDAITLYGFLDLSDLKLFENLISVSGIGPKTAMGIFGIASRDEIIRAIVTSDVDFFTCAPRLGRKNAQKIIIDLRNKFGSIQELDLSSVGSEKNNEVIAALKKFGFTTKETLEAIKNINADGEEVEEKIKLALKYLGK